MQCIALCNRILFIHSLNGIQHSFYFSNRISFVYLFLLPYTLLLFIGSNSVEDITIFDYTIPSTFHTNTKFHLNICYSVNKICDPSITTQTLNSQPQSTRKCVQVIIQSILSTKWNGTLSIPSLCNCELQDSTYFRLDVIRFVFCSSCVITRAELKYSPLRLAWTWKTFFFTS